MAINPAFGVTVSMRDRSGEPTSWSVNTTEARLADGAAGSEFIALGLATISLINGTVTRQNFTTTHRVSNAKFAAAGQREEKFLVSYEDQVTLVPYSFELPCRDTTLIPPANTDEYDLSLAPFAAYVTALEAFAVSPDGNTINVTSIRLMGKNS